jgi:hypothetical protein
LARQGNAMHGKARSGNVRQARQGKETHGKTRQRGAWEGKASED